MVPSAQRRRVGPGDDVFCQPKRLPDYMHVHWESGMESLLGNRSHAFNKRTLFSMRWQGRSWDGRHHKV